MKKLKLGLSGARGFTGRELLKIVKDHPEFDLAFASSRELAGEPVSDLVPGFGDLLFENLTVEQGARRGCDAVILALPDGASADAANVFEDMARETTLLDLSADHRFEPHWVYGLPELYGSRKKLVGANRIANPGCYATAAQLAIAPVRSRLSGEPSIFGVSGYSGAGSRPSPRNNPERLQDNLMPYALTGHKHEREVSFRLGHKVKFTPHVHPAFSGLLVTVHLEFAERTSGDELYDLYKEFYFDEFLVRVTKELPELKDGTNIPGAILGGFAVSEDGRHGVIIAVEDNLLKGAAVQAIQNLNIAFELDEYLGLK